MTFHLGGGCSIQLSYTDKILHKLVDRQGLEPCTSACKAGIFPAKLTAHWCILSTIHRFPSTLLSNGHNSTGYTYQESYYGD